MHAFARIRKKIYYIKVTSKTICRAVYVNLLIKKI